VGQEALLFCKKEAKNFFPFDVCRGRTTGLQWIKVFWFFSSEKNCFLLTFVSVQLSLMMRAVWIATPQARLAMTARCLLSLQ